MKQRYYKNRFIGGMSLLELLIYITILSGLVTVMSSAFLSLARARGQSGSRSEVNAAMRFVGERLKQDIKNASTVTTPALGSPSNTLVATVGGVTVTYDVVAGRLRRQEGVATPVFLTGNVVRVDSSLFTRIENQNTVLPSTTTSIQVMMAFRYNATSTDWVYSDTLRTAISLR